MNDHLPIALSAAVPLHIFELQARPDLADYMTKRGPEIARLLAEKGDRLLYRSKKKGETAEVFNAAAEGIALLAFVPGGVTAFGQTYTADCPALNPETEALDSLRTRLAEIENPSADETL